MHNAPTGLPLLVLDMYEHAYHMDYGAAAAKYVDAFMQNVQLGGSQSPLYERAESARSTEGIRAVITTCEYQRNRFCR